MLSKICLQRYKVQFYLLFFGVFYYLYNFVLSVISLYYLTYSVSAILYSLDTANKVHYITNAELTHICEDIFLPGEGGDTYKLLDEPVGEVDVEVCAASDSQLGLVFADTQIGPEFMNECVFKGTSTNKDHLVS